MSYTMAFALRTKVWIPELKTAGVVLAIHIADTGTQYSVRYFYNGAPQTVYFFAPELEAFRAPKAAA
ncbi:hypothetical protein [Nevskia ramosa]|uniref:hypothetical protein n=1 Tax=Nevskia ramosa TaxID=64002 RepID=UPI003D0DA235